MATVGELIVRIGANIKKFVSGMKEAEQTMKKTGETIQSSANELQQSLNKSFGRYSRYVDETVRRNRELMRTMAEAEKAVRDDFVKMALSAEQYKGKTDEFIASLEELGKKQKKIYDEMVANNEAMKVSLVQSIGTVLARTNQSQKIAENLERIGNPIRTLDQVLLKSLGNRLENLAKQGNVAVVALRELGPTANMKQLQDQIQIINQGIMRMQMLAMVSGIAFAGLTYGIIQLSNAIDGRLVEAFEQFKTVWIDALRPFITAFTEVALVVVKAGTAVGQFFATLAENQPVLSAMIFGFMYLFTALLFLLSPLAVGISRAGSLAVAFAQLWMTIKPLVLGFLTVAGTAAILAAAIVSLAALIYQLWNASEQFRNAIINGWNQIKNAILSALQPIAPAWERLKQAFLNMVATFLGSKPTMESIWKTLGDRIAVFINWFVQKAVPVIKAAFQAFASAAVLAMNIATKAFDTITQWWQKWGPWIKEIVGGIFENIKNVITSAINIITNIFQAFSNLLQGNWKGLWENIKAIVVNLLTFIWNYIQLWGLGRVLAFFRGFGGKLVSEMSGAWSRVNSAISSALSRIWSTIQSRFNSVLSFIRGLHNSFYRAGEALMDMLVRGIKAAASRVVSAVQGVVSRVRNYLPFSPAKEGPLSDLDRLDFAGPIAQSIARAIPMIHSMMGQLFSVPLILNPQVTQQIIPQPALAGGGDIYIENMYVRSDEDIKRIAQELYRLQTSRLRSQGVTR